jgi:hypothetical protein
MKRWGGRGLALSLVALLLQILVPAGYMVSTDPAGASLVICTGKGPLSAADLGHQPGKPPAPHADMACAFAGHGALAAPPTLSVMAHASVQVAPSLAQPFQDLTPGRGLAAPPPPSQGPPSSI